jgi:hypothetical protein
MSSRSPFGAIGFVGVVRPAYASVMTGPELVEVGIEGDEATVRYLL